jgi:hypothetical protein
MRSRVVITTLSLLFVVALSVVLALQSNTSHFDAAVKGQLLISGGPPPGTPRPSDGEVTAKNASGQAYSVSVPSTGKFTLQLPAGTYSLTGSSPHFGDGQYKCFAQRTVIVLRDKSVHEDVFCPEM